MDAQIVKRAAHDRWDDIITTLTPTLHQALEQAPKHVPCPFHGGKDGFRFFLDFAERGNAICNTCGSFDGFVLLMRANGWTFLESLNAVAEVLGLTDGTYDKTSTIKEIGPSSVQTQQNEHNRNKLNDVWRTTLPNHHPDAEPLRRYLRNRGLDLTDIPPVLRFHPALEYYEEVDSKYQLIGCFPAMAAMVKGPNGKPVNLHRTYLTNDGHKAKVSDAKKLMPPVISGATNGGAIRLYEPTDILAVAEGIETALAVHVATGLPLWATITAGGMVAVEIPKSIRKVRIAADLDKSCAGELAARELARRLMMEGRDVRIIKPKGPIPDNVKSVDWLDVLNEGQAA